jgi:hypothetical protein
VLLCRWLILAVNYTARFAGVIEGKAFTGGSEVRFCCRTFGFGETVTVTAAPETRASNPVAEMHNARTWTYITPRYSFPLAGLRTLFHERVLVQSSSSDIISLIGSSSRRGSGFGTKWA